MKRQTQFVAGLRVACGLNFVLASAASAADLRLDGAENTAAAAASRGGEFTLVGSIGQANAGVLTGNGVKLEAGFWHGVTLLQTPDAPRLSIRVLGDGRAAISWSVTATGFVLEHTSDPASGWSSVLSPVVDSPTEHTVTLSIGQPIRCYRLKRNQP